MKPFRPIIVITSFVLGCATAFCALEASNENFSSQITESRVFRQPIVYIGERVPALLESQQLWEALTAFRSGGESAGLPALEQFLSMYTNSIWAPSLKSVLANYYQERGRPTPALQHWEAAWNATKDAKGGTAKQIADFTLVHWTRLLASLGRLENLQALFKETAGRTLDAGPLQQIFFATLEGYRTMALQPERSYRCGTYALSSLAHAIAHTNAASELLRIESPATGFSMADLATIWERCGFRLTALRRESGNEIVVPSVVHWKQNHYAAIVRKSGNAYHVIDPTFGDPRWLSADAINAEASGAFIVPSEKIPSEWKTMTPAEMGQIYGKGYPNGFVDDDDQKCKGGSGANGGGGGTPTMSAAGGGGGGLPCKKAGCGGGGGGGGGNDECCEEGQNSGTSNALGLHQAASNSSEALQGERFGMPYWRVSEPYINLWVEDQPLGYQPARGRRVAFRLSYKQRDQVVRETNWFNVGLLWNCSWLSYAEPDGDYYTKVYLAGGGTRRYSPNSIEYNSNSRMDTLTNAGGVFLGYQITYANGARDIYDFLVTIGSETNAFLTGKVSAFGHTNRFEYTNYANGVVRLLRVVDAQNQTNLIYYATNHPYTSNLIARVVDPFGRETRIEYNTNGHLTNIVDVANLSSSFAYDTNGWMTNMTTPYGSTRFQMTFVTSLENLETNNRTALIAHPNGAKELYVYRDYCPSFLPTQYPDAPVDNPGYTDNWHVHLRNSFYWNRQQFAALPEAARTNISNLASNDFKLGRLRHWLHWPYVGGVVGQTMSIEREPSPTVNPAVEGQKTWYTYVSGALAVMLKIQVPNNDTNLPSRYTTNIYSLAGGVYVLTNQATTYSLANGSRGERTTKWIYDTNNWIDLLQVIGPAGDTEMQYGYNSNHQVIGETNALGYWTMYAYNGNGQVTNVTRSSGLTTTYTYDANGYLTNITDVQIGRSESFTYANGLVKTHTDPLGRISTNTWDALQRLTSVSDALGYISNVYTKLDLTAMRDRLGNWKYFTYDSMQQLTSETNELGRATTYSYCDCGALESITDALGNTTTFNYDLNGRTTSILRPGGLNVTNHYTIFGELTRVTDSAGNNTTNWYNHQGIVLAVSNAFGRVRSVTYDIEDRPITLTDANGISITNTLDDVGRILSRTYPDGGVEKFRYSASGLIGYTNQLGLVTKYTYDEAGRKIGETNAINEVTQFKYDASGNLTNLIDGKSQNTFWKYDQFGRMTNKVDHTGADMFRYAYDANDHLTNRWSPAKLNTYYAYDAAGNLTNVDYNVSADIRLAYDALNRLTNMLDAAGTTKYGYTGFGAVLSEDGPWENDTVSYGYDSGLRRSGLSLQQPGASAWALSYTHDAIGRLASLTSPAGVFGWSYTAAGSLVKGIAIPGSVEIVNTYDAVGRQTETRMRDVFTLVPVSTNRFVYDQAGRRTTNARNYHVWTRYEYDNAGQLRNAVAYQTNSSLRSHERFGYEYDAAGNLAFRTNAAMVQAFTVNSLNQLTNSTRSGNLTIAGNHNGAATNVTVSHNGLSATNMFLWPDNSFAKSGYILPDGTNTFVAVAKDATRFDTNTSVVFAPLTNSFAWDANGNLIWDGQKALEYDDENQLTRIIATNYFKSEFTYDGKLRRRVRREYAWQNSAWVLSNEVRYVYDGNLVLQERDNFNVPTVSYTRGTDLSGTLEGAGGIGGLLSRTDHSIFSIQPSEAHAYYHCDANGNVIAMIDAHQNVVARYAYEPFGRVFSMSSSLAEANVYRFSSKEADPSGLVYYLYRYYEPAMQRWINRDPIQEAGGWNLYGFVNNNPVSRYDPFGLFPPPPPRDPYCLKKCAKQNYRDLSLCMAMTAGIAVFCFFNPALCAAFVHPIMSSVALCYAAAQARYLMCLADCVLIGSCPPPVGPYPGSWPHRP